MPCLPGPGKPPCPPSGQRSCPLLTASPEVGASPAPMHREPCPTRAPGWPLHHLSGPVRKILAWPGDRIPQQEPWSSTHESESLREGCSVQPTGHSNCHRETCGLLALVASLLSAPRRAPLLLQPPMCLLCPVRLCDPMNYSLPDSSVYEMFPGKNTGVGIHFLLQGIFPTQGSNLRLLFWQADSLPLNHLGSPASVETKCLP